MRKVTLSEMLGHPMTRSAVQQLAQGVDPRLVAAQTAGTALADHIARQFGMQLPLPRIDSTPVEAVKKTAKKDDDVIDAEYTVVSVSPGVKHRKKAV